ncbi:MAG TPA: hypothetical protein VF601_11275 [Beijerinckiaceae bacterium]|jgi:DNA-binding cell septation regulator SpoVG
MQRIILSVAVFMLGQAISLAAECNIMDRDNFISGGKKEPVLLANGKSDSDPGIILFKSGLRVNTDGAPNSYHPNDLQGKTLAINNICNGISVKDLSTGKFVSCPKARTVFGQFRDSDWNVPSGFRISWQNVLAARNENGRTIPCVFRQGDFKGYFGSLTSLKNGLSGNDAGECEAKNQLDQRFVPALVLAGGSNVLKTFGARKGDLVLAHNPANGITQAAVIGDFGPPDNIGEGSVALNIALLKKTDQPKTYDEAKKLDTGSQEILVAIIPKSASFELKRPYAAGNLSERVGSWAKANGYNDTAGLQVLMRTCEPFL